MQQKLIIFPKFGNVQQAYDILNRIAWGLCGLADQEISLYVEGCPSDIPSISAGPRESSLSSAQENYLGELPPIFTLPDVIEAGPGDFALCWDNSAYASGFTGIRPDHTIMLDPFFHFNHEADQIAALQYTISTDEKRAQMRGNSLTRYKDFLARWKNTQAAYLYLTGPTIETAFHRPVDRDAIQMICNSLVKNRALLEKIQPDVLIFSDPAYHFGISRYAASFRDHVRQSMEAFPQMLCMIPERYFPLTSAFLGEKFSERIIGIPLVQMDGFHFPSVNEFHSRETGNVLTSLMIPVASSLTDQINILGADGRARSDKGYWSHGRSSQLSSLLQTINESHPSLARDEDVEKYYQEHIVLLEKLIQYGERIHKKEYLALTPSMIPALAIRAKASR